MMTLFWKNNFGISFYFIQFGLRVLESMKYHSLRVYGLNLIKFNISQPDYMISNSPFCAHTYAIFCFDRAVRSSSVDS